MDDSACNTTAPAEDWDETTSPSQLQEVTLDPNMNTTTFVDLSPGKAAPPARGYAMKEYEEQLSHLKKENFNLKLRIYFLEERTGRISRSDDKEEIVKKNIELKVEAETLRKDVSDKQELLCQAAKALELMEEQHHNQLKQLHSDRDTEKKALELQIQELEKEFELLKERCAAENTATQGMMDSLQSQVSRMETQILEENERSIQLESELHYAQQKAKHVKLHCQGLEEQLKKRDSHIEDLVQELDQKGQDLANSNHHITVLEEALSAKEPEIQIKVQQLSERDHIIEEKQSQIDQKDKVLVEIQITLDEKQRQIDALRSSLAARDESIASLGSRLEKAKANARNWEAKLNATVQESKRLKEEVETLKTRHRACERRSFDRLEACRPQPPRRSAGCPCPSSYQFATVPSPQSKEDAKLADKLKERENALRAMEAKEKTSLSTIQKANNDLRVKEQEVQLLRDQVKSISKKLKDVENNCNMRDEKITWLESENNKCLHTIQSFSKMCKGQNKDLEQLKTEAKKKDRHIRDKTSQLNECREACNKAKWEARQLQAQARVQGVGGVSAAFDEVKDMAEEENERLWAEVEDKNKRIIQLTEERDGLSLEMEKQVQALLDSLKEKEECLEKLETQLTASTNDILSRDNRIVELEQELANVRASLENLHEKKEKKEESQQTECDEKSDLSDGSATKNEILFTLELADKNREIERLNTELRKRTTNLQELVNKELWDKNREIEKLQDRLNTLCCQKGVEIMALQQQIGTKDLQLKLLQDQVTQLGVQMSVPSTVLQPLTFNQHVHIQHPAVEEPKEPVNLKDEVLTLQEQLLSSVEEKKYLCQKLEELREQITNTSESDKVNKSALCGQCIKMKGDVKRAEVLRKETEEVCAMLTRRLEELATFLSSLLKCHKCLGGLAPRRRQMLKQVVENSMELSRRLTISFSESQEPNDSILQLSSISGFLASATGMNLSLLELWDDEENSSCGPGQENGTKSSDTLLTSDNLSSKPNVNSNHRENIFVDRDKIMSEQTQVITRLRSQIEVLTEEIKQRDIEISHAHFDKTNSVPDITHEALVENSGITFRCNRMNDDKDSIREAESSFNSMTFYNSQHTIGDGKTTDQWSGMHQSFKEGVKSNSGDDKELSLTSKQEDTFNKSISPLKSSPTRSEGAKYSPPGKADSVSKSGGSQKIRHSSSANAVTLSILHPPSQHREYGVASLSESEAWSEPDRNVSMARIGLQEDNSVVGAGCTAVGSARTRGIRSKEVDNSSESSEETAREVSRTPGKRSKGDSGDSRRLQNKIRGLEQLNEALRAELDILHQLTSKSNDVQPLTKDISVNTSRTKLDKSTSVEELKDDDSVTIPANLLEQIRYQREKLESSLFHNDFIRRQLEAIFTTLTNSQGDDIVDVWQKLKETTEELCVARSKVQELEKKLLELETQLEENKNRAQQLEATVEQLQVTRRTVSLLKEQIINLETRLKEKDNEILEQNCMLLESRNKNEEQHIVAEKAIEDSNKLKEEFERQVQEAELLLADSERRVQEAEQQLKEEEKKLQEIEKQKETFRNETSGKIKKLELEIYEAERRRNEAEIQVIEAKKLLQEEESKRYEAEWKLQALEEKIKVKEGEFEKHYHELLERRIKEIEIQASLQIREAKKKLEQREWMHKTETEKKVEEAERLGGEFEAGLRRQIEEAERQARMFRAEGEKQIKELEEKFKCREAELKKKAQESERRLWEKDSELRQQLDEASMKHSQAALERTRLVNEKLHLEQEVRRHECRETELTREKKEAENLLVVSKEKLDTQIFDLEQKRSDLERRVRELEYINSELEQRLAKLHMTESYHSHHSSSNISGPHSSSSLPYHKADAGSSSSGLDTLSGDGGSLPSSPWSLPIGTVEERSRKEDSNCGGLSALSNLVLQHGFNRQRSEVSDYMSEEQPVEEYEAVFTQTCSSSYWVTVSGNSSDHVVSRNVNSSPDLGIESDQGRFSSLETSTLPPPVIHLETEESAMNQTEGASDIQGTVSTIVHNSSGGGVTDDYARLQKENAKLRCDLIRTRRSLKATLSHLTSCNNLKKQLERAICKQLHKTHHILKQARDNLDGEAAEYCTPSTEDF